MENQWVARLTAISLSMVIFGSGIAWLDGRHAAASDVSELRNSIDRERLERIEFEISELERNGLALKRSSAVNQERPEVQARLLEIEARRDRYLRKREELLLEIGEK